MSGDLLVVVPVVTSRFADECIWSMTAPDSSAGFDRAEILVVDNSRDGWVEDRYQDLGLRIYRDPDGHNLGVARSWNVAAREVLDRGLDYLVICSAAMQFGPILQCTWRWQLEQFWGADVIETEGHSWHAIAIHRRLFELVGLFDGNFYPGYIEQIDWCTRLRILGREGGWRHVWFNAMSQGSALHVDAGNLKVVAAYGGHVLSAPADPLLDYYARKWGGPKGAETFALPWGSAPMSWQEDEPIPELAERYGLGEYGVGWW